MICTTFLHNERKVMQVSPQYLANRAISLLHFLPALKLWVTVCLKQGRKRTTEGWVEVVVVVMVRVCAF